MLWFRPVTDKGERIGEKNHLIYIYLFFFKFNTFLRIIDEKLGELGVGRVLDFLGQLIDVFCKFFHIDMANINDLQKIAETVRALIDQVGQQLSSLFGRLAITGN